MSCYRCGGSLGPDALFCPRCGTPVTPAQIEDRARTQLLARPPRRTRAAAVWAGVAAGVVAAALIGGGAAFYLRTRDTTPVAQTSVTSASGTSAAPTDAAAHTSPTAPTPSATPTASLATVYARERTGVVRIETLGCGDSEGIGTGFLLSPTLVATVAHVVSDSVVVGLVDGDQRTTGEVVGYDPSSDLALVQAAAPISGYHFRFAPNSPQVGDPVAAVGFPVGEPITLTEGTVSGLNRRVDVEGNERTGLIQTDAAVNPGNSGGPLLASDGTVVGLVDALDTEANGIAYAVPAGQASPEMTTWTTDEQPQAAASCDDPAGSTQETGTLDAIPGLPSYASSGVADALNTYFDGINSGDYASAFGVFSARKQAGTSVASLADGDASSYDYDQSVVDARMANEGSARVTLSFVSLQDASKGPDGDTCDVWTLVYTMVQAADGSWRIDATKPYDGSTHTSC